MSFDRISFGANLLTNSGKSNKDWKGRLKTPVKIHASPNLEDFARMFWAFDARFLRYTVFSSYKNQETKCLTIKSVLKKMSK